MTELRVPSLQHLARNWRYDPAVIAKVLVKLALDPPRFSYNPLYLAVRDLLVLQVPYDQVVEGIKRIKRERVRNNLLSALPLIREHFAGITPDFFQTIGKRYYPVGRGLMIPFEAPMIYGVGGQLYFPWFSFWRANPIAKERLALFVTLVEEVLLQDPDLESARFEILDFSCPVGKDVRTLKIIDAQDIPRVDDATKRAMLEIFAEGYFLAQAELARKPKPERGDEPDGPNPSQLSFW